MKIIINNSFLAKIYLNSQKVFLLVAFFLYIYSIPFRVLPFGLGTRMIFTFFGLILVYLEIYKKAINKKPLYVNQGVLLGAFLLLTLVSFSLLSMLINSTRDFALIRYSLSMFFIFIAGYFIVYLFRKVYTVVTFEIISKNIIVVVLIQVTIAALLFLYPTVRKFLFDLQTLSEFDSNWIKGSSGYRLIGFGSGFFGAGIVNGYALMLIATMLKKRDIKLKQVFFYALAFLLILSLGMMMARTTIIGGIFALLILFSPSRLFRLKLSKKVLSFYSSLIIIPIIILFLIPSFSEKNRDRVNHAIDYGFELFVNYASKGKFTTTSTDALKKSYILPTHLKTYLIGDGYFADPRSPNDSYYMGVDAGYLRLVYYFGLLGLLCYFMFQLTPVIISMRKNEHIHNFFFISSFAYLLILNLKGFTDILLFSILFCFTQYGTNIEKSNS